MTLLLLGATTADGEVVDVVCADGVVRSVEPAGAHLPARPDEESPQVVDLDGFLLLPAPAEPHAHLDKALTADLVDNPVGDLAGAITAMRQLLPTLTPQDTAERATRAALMLLHAGATAIRTHVDVGPATGLRGLEALAGVRERLRGLLDLQLAVLPAGPLTGREGAGPRAMLRDSLAMADVVGGCPHLDPDPRGCQEFCLQLAVDAGLPLDLHTDENTDPGVLHLGALADRVGELRPADPSRLAGVTASHCVSLGSQPLEVQRDVAARLAAADVGVVTLPQTNLFLQARGVATSPPRGLTAVAALLEAGVDVGAGGDNLRDPFNLVGRGDPLEIASLLVAAGHLSPRSAYALVSDGARRVMGLAAAGPRPGAAAELLAVRASGLSEAVAAAPADRVVVHQGRVVARSTLRSWLADLPALP